MNYKNFVEVCNHNGFGKLFNVWDLFFVFQYYWQTCYKYHLIISKKPEEYAFPVIVQAI